MGYKLTTFLPLCLLAVILLARPAHAFGAGNIGSLSKIEGTNWRHGDIEDALLGLITARAVGRKKKFSKLDVARVYFGNWLRDYSQAVDVGTVKYVSAEAIRLLLWILGFMSFGYGTGEFEVTKERLGCYRPEEHIDNPRNYADNEDARQYDPRLRGPVDERRELSIDPETGMKNYIANENIGITTSAGLIRHLFQGSIELGRRYGENGDKRDFYEALRLLGTGLHCLEDYSAHSNYTELALIELGERDIFPHVGRNTQMRLRDVDHPVYPIITGTFGGVDFLHSVMGELGDKATQSEIEGLEHLIEDSQNADNTMLKDLLDKLPSGLLGGSDEKKKADELQDHATAAQMQNMNISPKEPEEFTRQMEQLHDEIYPILEWHDNLLKRISEAIEKIPVLPELIEQVQERINIFVFSLIAPYILPVIRQVKEELNTGSSEIIKSSKQQQLIVFHDDDSTDPTHSMLSKDHFSNVLNEPAGKIASAVVKWVVPQIVAAWDDPRVDIQRTNDRIINGVFHHPAKGHLGADGARDGHAVMFEAVKEWWASHDDRTRDDLRNKLSRDGVKSMRNHKEGVADCGHGCGTPLKMAKMSGGSSSSGSGGGNGGSSQAEATIEAAVGKAAGGGALGGILGGLAGAVGGGLLGGKFSSKDAEKTKYEKQGRDDDGSYTSGVIETGHVPGSYGQPERYGQAEMSSTQYSSGGHREQYQRYEQDGSQGRTGYGYSQSTDTRPTAGGGYEERTEQRYEHPGGRYESETYTQGVDSSGASYSRSDRHQGRRKSDASDDSVSSSGSRDDWEKKEKKRRKKEEKRLRKMREREGHEGGGEYGSSSQQSYGGYGGGGQSGREEYGGSYGGGGSGRQEYGSSGRQDYGSSGRQEYGSSGRQEYGSSGRDEYGSSGRQDYGSSGRQDYGSSGRQEYGSSGRQEYGSSGPQEYGSSGRQEYGSSGRQEYGSSGRDDYGSSGRQGYGNSGRQEYGQGSTGLYDDERPSGQSGYGQSSSQQGYGGQSSGQSGYGDQSGYGGRY